MKGHQAYYVPEQSKWPIIATIGLSLLAYGAGSVLTDIHAHRETGLAWILIATGTAILIYIFFGWFSLVIKESRGGLYSPQLDRSFRWGMFWFIFSEVMFFAAFFGALFYARHYSVPWLGGEGAKGISQMLWPDFHAVWPPVANPDPKAYPAQSEVVNPWHIPLINTLILLTSSITVTLAHKALKQGQRGRVKLWLSTTIVLGSIFLAFQVVEFVEAYSSLNLTLQSGIYGSTFFMLTGFHSAHVVIGGIILFVMLIRIFKGHFDENNNFGFEAASWYWHFVDVVWLCLFTFVYVL